LLTDVVVSWSAPYNGGVPISAYVIKIKQANSAYSVINHPHFCNGSLASVIASRTCTIPFFVLQASPYNLPWGSSIFATVAAINLMGTSLTSAEGNGAIILSKPDAPINLQQDFMNSNAYSLAFTWSDGYSNGGTPIIDYRVYYDGATNGTTFTILDYGILTRSY